MTYLGFLLQFLAVPILLTIGLEFLGRLIFQQWKRGGSEHQASLIGRAILLHTVIAVLYTTPWDNYLVANRIWWYDPNLVAGLKIGYVPIEEYGFFVLQPLLVGLWLRVLLQNNITRGDELSKNEFIRFPATIILCALWLGSTFAFLIGWEKARYLSLELIWALPPLILQVVFGADILWGYRRQIILSILPLTIYLSVVDYVAIQSGTWTINPQRSLGILFANVLPLEEVVFFLLTNSLITFGIILICAPESKARIISVRKQITQLVWNY